MRNYVQVRYIIEGDPKDLEPKKLIEDFSFHIDINTQIRSIYKTEGDGESHDGVDLVSLSQIDDGVFEVTLRIPIPDTAGDEYLLYVFSIILGNIIRGARFTRILLRELQFPEKIMAGLPGPAMGLDGIKSFLGCGNQNILSSPLISPGNAIDASVSRALELVKAGVSLVPDSPARYYADFEECVEYIEGFITAVATAELRAICFVNANFGFRFLDKMVSKLKTLSRTLGWPVGLRVDPMLVGIGVMERLRRSRLPLFCYSQFNRLIYSSSAGVANTVLTQLLRSIGADIISVGAGRGETYDKGADTHASISCMLQPWRFRSNRRTYEIPRTLPIVTGGLTPRIAHEVALQYPTDVGFHIGRGILGGPLNLSDNVAAFKESISAANNGKAYESFLEGDAKHLANYERAKNRS